MYRPLHIYYVEDDVDFRELFRDALSSSSLSHQLHEFEDGSSLMDVLYDQDCKGTFHVDLIILDLHLPLKNGLQVLRELKYHPRFKLIPVIMVTENESPESIQTAFGVGANAYLNKTAVTSDVVSFLQALATLWGQAVAPPELGALVSADADMRQGC